jgi:general secretion pathway protein K
MHLLKAFKKTNQSVRREAGAALMMAIFCVTMLMVIATEIMYETNVELAVSSQSVNQVKAHYSAIAAVEISLLRIFIYRKASSMIPANSPLKSMLDPIWQVPFTWPPIVPEGTSRVNKDEIKESVKASAMQGSYLATIEAESAKLDINDLASPLKGIVDNTKTRIKDLFKAKIESDEAFDKKYRNYDFDTLIGNIKDYVDEDKNGEDGGQEGSKYTGMGENTSGVSSYPPNQPFKTIEEIHMVAGMTDEFFDVLKPNITIYGSKGINVNYCGKDIFRAMDPVQFTDEKVGKIMERRSDPNLGGPYKDDKDFLGFVQGLGIRDEWYYDDQKKPKILLLYDSEYNFRIRATGTSGKVQKDITAIVYDFDRVKTRLSEVIALYGSGGTANANTTVSTGGTGGTGGNATTPKKTETKDKVPNERPNIVYWNEH